MIPLPFSITLLTLITLSIYLGLGQRVLDRMRMKGSTALILLLVMIFGHFLPTISLNTFVALNMGVIVPLGVAVYLLSTTSRLEQKRALLISALTGVLLFFSDKLLPLEPGYLDPVFSGGIFAGLLSSVLGRSRRGAFIAGILGVFIVDLVNLGQLWFQGIDQQSTIGSGGILSSMVIGSFLAVLLTEVIGEIREKLALGGNDDDETV